MPNDNLPASIAERMAPATGAQSESTRVEQSRAMMEVQGAIVVARQHPRSIERAVEAMQQSTGVYALAARSFFRFGRGSQQVTGASVHLARDLARCWGNIVYGVKELNRDDYRGASEMLAYAWDLETNARSETAFIVPHDRDTRQGRKRLTDVRDIYENNANAGARRLRECIFAVLPPWFIEEAKERCTRTLENGGGKPLPQRRAHMIAAFAERGVSQPMLEAKIGRAADQWVAADVAQMEVVFTSLRRGETTVEEEFPVTTKVEALAAPSSITRRMASPATAAKPDPAPSVDANTGEVMEPATATAPAPVETPPEPPAAPDKDADTDAGREPPAGGEATSDELDADMAALEAKQRKQTDDAVRAIRQIADGKALQVRVASAGYRNLVDALPDAMANEVRAEVGIKARELGVQVGG